MALLESRESHVPEFVAPEGTSVRRIQLGAEQKLEYFKKVPLFGGLLDADYETRPGESGPVKVLVKDALLEHAEFWEIPQGALIFQEGSFGEYLFVLLRGHTKSSTGYALDAGRTARVPIEDMHEGAFMGEHSALSMNAHLVTVEAVTPALVMLLPQFIAQELTKTHESFRALIMQDYVSRAVHALVRRIPMMRFASDEEFAEILDKADLRSFEVGDMVFAEGDEPEHLYVIHNGFVKIAKQEGNEQKVISYLVEGDCFGETGCISGAKRGASAIALSRAEVLILPGAEFKRIVESNPQAAAEVSGLENVRKLESDMIQNVTFIGSRMEFQAEVMPNLDVIVIDENLCVRCDNCVTSCSDAHADGFSRLIRKGVSFEEFLLPTACRFCQDPVCLLCKSGGIKRDKDGDIYFTENCIGCSGCAQRCPYGNITMVETAEIGRPPVPSLLDVVLKRTDRPRKGVPAPSEFRPSLKKIPVKCDLDKGHLYPACVSNCPTGAIRRYRADELDRIIAGRI